MADVSRHPRIRLLTLAKVEDVKGSVGNFKVKIRQKARYVDVKECTACGDCVAVCPVLVPNEFEMGLTTRRAIHQLFPQAVPAAFSIDMDHCLGINPIACGKCAEVFACNWCSYAGGDFAGVSRLQYPPTMRLIRTMCSGRVDKKWILHAFAKGAPVVLVSGCHYVDCHYIDANRWTQKRVEKLWDQLEKKGIRPERLQLEWISSAQASRFQETMVAIEKIRKTVTPEEIEATKEALAKNLLEVEIHV